MSSRVALSLGAASRRSCASTGYQLRRCGLPSPATLKGSMAAEDVFG